jgi:hypothetical protein
MVRCPSGGATVEDKGTLNIRGCWATVNGGDAATDSAGATALGIGGEGARVRRTAAARSGGGGGAGSETDSGGKLGCGARSDVAANLGGGVGPA